MIRPASQNSPRGHARLAVLHWLSPRGAICTAVVAGGLALAAMASGATPVHAAVCASGPYRAGCAGPNGAFVVHKPVGGPRYGGGYARPPVTCVRGVYRAGCVGPNGSFVRHY